MYKLHKELGTDYCLFRPLVKYDLKNPSKMVEEPEVWVHKAISKVEWLTTTRKVSDISIGVGKFYRYANWDRPYKACYAASLSGVVTPNGKVWACVNRRGFPGSCIGDLSSEPFIEVWQRQQRWQDFDQCRVLCRGDEVNLALAPLMEPMEHENFI
jgi:sulfatase maturation enzyme AslB (radical SAM superfamily)